MKPRSVIFPILFAWLLLLSQQLGMAHAISHFSSLTDNTSSQDKQLPAEKLCSQCLAFAQIGSGLSSSPHIFIATKNETFAAQEFVRNFFPIRIRAFHSRAPPVHV